jgi:hypothetical protein
MPISFERFDSVAKRRACSRRQVYIDVDRGLLTPPIRRGKLALFVTHEVDEIINAEIAGKSEDERRALVRQLLERRTQGHQAAVA